MQHTFLVYYVNKLRFVVFRAQISNVLGPITQKLINAEDGKCSLSAQGNCPMGPRIALVWLLGALHFGSSDALVILRICFNFSCATEPSRIIPRFSGTAPAKEGARLSRGSSVDFARISCTYSLVFISSGPSN